MEESVILDSEIYKFNDLSTDNYEIPEITPSKPSSPKSNTFNPR